MKRDSFSVGDGGSIYWLVLDLLKTFSWQELRHHPWRNASAIAAVMLGVALALSVSLINRSALQEFSQAVRSVNGQADLQVHAATATFDEDVYGRIATDLQVLAASPIVESRALVQRGSAAPVALRVIGVDALQVARTAPDMAPIPFGDAPRLALFDPQSVFLNAAASGALGLATGATSPLQLQSGTRRHLLQVAGSVGATGAPLAVMDIGAAQDLLALTGRLSRIDLRLRAGLDPASVAAQLRADPRWPAGLVVELPPDADSGISNLSRAYRVNLTVLALVALFTGAFLVFSVLALSVNKRAQQFALLGVLGLSGRDRMRLVLAESLALGLVGSMLGVLLGSLLAWLALRWLGGDLGGGYFRGVAPRLQWSSAAALGYGLLGVAAAMVGAWMPARSAARLPLSQTLKGLGQQSHNRSHPWLALCLMLACALLALAPPLWGMALAAYLAIALLLVGGIGALPSLIALLYDRLAPALGRFLLPMLAVERARRVRASAAVAVSGVVASLSLAVALTVMVASFRHSVQDWLDIVLPADLYLRQGPASPGAGFAPDLITAIGAIPGVRLITPVRSQSLNLAAGRPDVALLARPLADPARALALVGPLRAAPADTVAVYVSEPMLALYGAQVGADFDTLGDVLLPQAADGRPGPRVRFFVAGVWRDYARQFGAIAIDLEDYVRLTADRQVNDLALSLAPGADAAQVQRAVQEQVELLLGPGTLDMASAGELRATSLRIFDRSFAVTYWLQAVAIAIGLFGVAANFSAQVLSRRKEFGLLVHLGLTQRQLLTLVAFEGLAWTAIGALAGLLLGLGVSVILVHVVNPQSFHWTMDLLLPWPQLAALCGATVLAGTATAWLAARAAARHDVVLAVKEDW
jgi:putative ABC transport system permease protein